jgi:type II secretory ATPase GspE/PulE/Tfp pilus assembly ATPase PilB-like protein
MVAVMDTASESTMRNGHMDLKVIRELAELPPYGQTLTDTKGPCELSAALRADVALIELVAGGPKRCAMVWTNRVASLRSRQDAAQLARQSGWEIDVMLEASADLIRMLYRPDWAKPDAAPYVKMETSDAERILDRWFTSAMNKNASDIHLQVHEDRGLLFYRVHGDLILQSQMRREEADQLSEASFWAAIGDSKGESFKKTVPQDAALERTVQASWGSHRLKARWASMPVQDGWDITMRLLSMGRSTQEQTLASLGYSPAHIAAFERMQGRPVGGIIMVGTTGSGKSTTLQTLLAKYIRRHGGRRLVRTIEDPVEYAIAGARQSSVVRRTGVGNSADDARAFQTMLKGAMRTDPDGLMVGEIRDEDTAQLVQRAIQTGHKVWSTLHAGNPFDAIDRLEDLGIKRSVLGSGEFIAGIIFQRLIPVLCPACKEPWHAGKEFLPADQVLRIERAFGDKTAGIFLRGRHRECAACEGQGVSARTVAAEMLVPDRTINQLITQSDMLTARAYWRAGLARLQPDVMPICGQTALEHAMSKAELGLVSPDDIEHELGLIDDLPDREADREFVLSNHPEWTEIRTF